jgi:hypothetical protein
LLKLKDVRTQDYSRYSYSQNNERRNSRNYRLKFDNDPKKKNPKRKECDECQEPMWVHKRNRKVSQVPKGGRNWVELTRSK